MTRPAPPRSDLFPLAPEVTRSPWGPEGSVEIDLEAAVMDTLDQLLADADTLALLRVMVDDPGHGGSAITLRAHPQFRRAAVLNLDNGGATTLAARLVQAADAPRCRRSLDGGLTCLEYLPCPMHRDSEGQS